MILSKRSVQRCIFMKTVMIVMIFAMSSAILMAADWPETYNDGIRFELCLASMEKVDGWKSMPNLWNQPVWISSIISLSNADVAKSGIVKRGDAHSVSLLLNEEGTLKLARLTKAHIGEYVAILINGRVVSVPKIIDEIIGGRAEIAGNFTEEEARILAEGIMVK